jgi:hypothetical protein
MRPAARRISRNLRHRVGAICREAQRELRVAQHNSKVVVVCLRLVPEAPILRYAGTFGSASNATTTDFYAPTFNNGGSDPTSPLSPHWVVGRGTWAAMRNGEHLDASIAMAVAYAESG